MNFKLNYIKLKKKVSYSEHLRVKNAVNFIYNNNN